MRSSPASAHRRSVLGVAAVALTAAVFGVVALSSAAVSKSHTLARAKSVHVGSVEEPIAVTARGAPVYELSPETAHHLLCTMNNGCLNVWLPVKVAHGSKPTKDSGVHGRLGTLRRGSFTQVTLNGHPVYTFVVDAGHKGHAHGDQIHSFGGVWHVFKEGATEKSGGSSSSSSSSSPAPPPPVYNY